MTQHAQTCQGSIRKFAVKLRNCPACGRDNRQEPVLLSQNEWCLKACASCEFVYLENAPTYEELGENLAWEKGFAEEKKRREAAEPVLQRLNTAVTRVRKTFRRSKLMKLVAEYIAGGHVLDVGCGAGKYLAMLPSQYIPHGIEISVSLARAASGIAVSRGGAIVNGNALDALAQFEKDRFSGIIMQSYLEHEVNPKAVLQAARRVLRKDGAIIIKVPNYASVNRKVRGRKWCGFRFPDHVNYFRPDSLRQMLMNTGFTIKRMNFTDRLPTSDNMWAVAGAA